MCSLVHSFIFFNHWQWAIQLVLSARDGADGIGLKVAGWGGSPIQAIMMQWVGCGGGGVLG